jgi:predicted 3-demethylubiquinone-9 3-methyltransferase (glyoxalase superfamily)
MHGGTQRHEKSFSAVHRACDVAHFGDSGHFRIQIGTREVKVETVDDFMATFELEGQRFHALNGAPQFKFNEAISFISVEIRAEVDYFWNRLSADGGAHSQCGWLKDKFRLSWQVVPTALGRYLSDPDRKTADRAMQAMMKMQKIVIADLDKAYAG